MMLKRARRLAGDPLLAIDRGARAYRAWRRAHRVKGTPAEGLKPGQLTTLELLEDLRGRPIRTIYDVGAMVGAFTRLARSVFPDAAVEAFEPLAQHHDRFRATTAALPRVRLHPVALGSAAQSAAMYVTSASAGSSVLPLGQDTGRRFGIETVGRADVRVVRLDDYIREAALPPPDLLKLDVQGYELEVLRGAEEAVRAAAALVIEVSFIELYQGQALFHDIDAFCRQHGFHLHAFGADTVLGSQLVQADACFIRDGHKP